MTDLTPERLVELRALAAAATPGPWAVERHLDMGDPPATWHIPYLERWRGYTNNVGFGEDEATARYVAAVSPDVVVGLLDEIERLRVVVDDVAAEGAPTDDVGVCVWCSDPETHTPDCAWLKVEADETRQAEPEPEPVTVVSGDMAVELPGLDQVVDLMAALERSVAAAKEARSRRPQTREDEREDER